LNGIRRCAPYEPIELQRIVCARKCQWRNAPSGMSTMAYHDCWLRSTKPTARAAARVGSADCQPLARRLSWSRTAVCFQDDAPPPTSSSQTS
jgi:hypothetical protein